MRYRSLQFWFFGALVLAIVLTGTDEARPAASAALRVDPPRMLYWGTLLGTRSNAYICEVLRTSEIVEADETQMNRAKLLPCGRSYGGEWLHYTVLMTWRCPGRAGPCSYWNNHIYGDFEDVPSKALLHHSRAGSVTCTAPEGDKRTISWKAGDSWDVLHVERQGYKWLCGYYRNRPPGTHRFPNPAHPWTKEAVKRYARARLAQGFRWARIDEVHRSDGPDWSDVAEYTGGSPEENFGRFVEDQATMLAGMRQVEGWRATCPSQHEFWGEREMKLNRAGGCVSSEGFPHGGGIIPNLKKSTIKQLRDEYGHRLQNTEAWDNNSDNDNQVPNNLILSKRYESTERNIRGAAMMVKQALISNEPNLYWLMDCGDGVVTYGKDLQEAVGYGGDRVYCIDHWGALRDPVTGRLPIWYQDKYVPKWKKRASQWRVGH